MTEHRRIGQKQIVRVDITAGQRRTENWPTGHRRTGVGNKPGDWTVGPT